MNIFFLTYTVLKQHHKGSSGNLSRFQPGVQSTRLQFATILMTQSLNLYLLLVAYHLLMQSGDVESNPGPILSKY